MTTDTKTERWIGNLVAAICDPIIVCPGGWGEDIPDDLKTKITTERLIENIIASKEGREITATDAETAWYLSSASLCAPLDHDWAEIYLYVATAMLERDPKKTVPEDIRVTSLTEYQWSKLKHLKRWIYDTRVKHRKDKAREARQDERSAAAPAIVAEKREELKVLQASFL